MDTRKTSRTHREMLNAVLQPMHCCVCLHTDLSLNLNLNHKHCCDGAGETMPDEGSAYICGHSMQREMAAARQLVGYCPQFDALPGTLTGKQTGFVLGFSECLTRFQRHTESD